MNYTIAQPKSFAIMGRVIFSAREGDASARPAGLDGLLRGRTLDDTRHGSNQLQRELRPQTRLCQKKVQRALVQRQPLNERNKDAPGSLGFWTRACLSPQPKGAR